MLTPDQLSAKFKRMGAAMERNMENATKAIAGETHGLMVQRIQKNSGTGRVYKRGARTHKASSPGEYPNTDTGALVRSIYWRMVNTLTAHVGTPILYGKYLEYGTSKMAARPFIKPTWADMKQRSQTLFNKAFKDSINV
jgi:HK97 gp10 family phage protein